MSHLIAHLHTSTFLLRAQGEDDGSTLLRMGEYLRTRNGEKPLGVYALYDEGRHLQYVGYSRNIVLAVKVRAMSA